MKDIKAVIVAGGRGARLRPYTMVLPKPLLPVGDQSVLGLLLKQIRKSGIRDVYIILGYLGDLIRATCQNSWQKGINLHFVQEEEPLGTIGGLSLLRDRLSESFVVANGDVVADLNLRRLVEFHRSHGGVATVACHLQKLTVDFGVVRCNGGSRVEEFVEKPTQEVLVNMGLYVFEPRIVDLIPQGSPYGVDDLMQNLLQGGEAVHCYLHQGRWLDIGNTADLARAQEVFNAHRDQILGD